MPGIKSINQRDRFMFPIVLSSSKTLRLYEGGAVRNCVIAAGTYYLHSSANADYPGLYAALLTAINAACTADFGFFSCTPALSSLALGHGLELRQVGGAPIDWEISWTGTTLDPRLLGFPAGASGYAFANASGSLRGPLTRWGDWIPLMHATSKDRDVVRMIKAGTKIVESAYFEQSDFGSRSFRSFEYRLQPAAACVEIVDPIYQEAGGFDGDEAHAAFETLHREGLGKRARVLVVHDVGDISIALPAGSWEVVVLRDDRQAESFRACLKKQNVGGERYSVAFDVAIVQGAGGYAY